MWPRFYAQEATRQQWSVSNQCGVARCTKRVVFSADLHTADALLCPVIGKWHLGEGKAHEPSGFDYWTVLPGQGEYWDPAFIEPSGSHAEKGYATDIITDKSLAWIESVQTRDKSQPFFLMCHHKAPHRSWESHPRHRHLYQDKIRVPETWNDDYRNRAKAASLAKMRVAEDLTYLDLGLVQPEGSAEAVGERLGDGPAHADRKVPAPADVTNLKLVDKEDGTVFRFKTPDELAGFKYQRYMQRYLRTIQSIDDNVGRMLDYLDAQGLADSTMVIYSSDQGFFLGEHGWFDKRFMYEESFQMPLLVRYPATVAPGSVSDAIISNVDLAPTWLDYAGLRMPTFMQGVSFRGILNNGGQEPPDWQSVAYHRYWMNNDWMHHALAHYGVRDRRYKLIYWYNEALGVEGARPGTDFKDKEWELFDCLNDPLELFNAYNEPGYKDVVEKMTGLLEAKMEEIGDEPVHTRP